MLLSSIYPHKGEAVDSELIKIGYELNNPLLVQNGKVELSPIANCSGDGVIVESIMLTESGNPALRLYESKGRETAANLKINIPYKEVAETNMLFADSKPCNPDLLKFTPYEVKTLVIKC